MLSKYTSNGSRVYTFLILHEAVSRSPVAIILRLYVMHHLHPPPLKLSHKCATAVAFQIYEMGSQPITWQMTFSFTIRPCLQSLFNSISFYCNYKIILTVFLMPC